MKFGCLFRGYINVKAKLDKPFYKRNEVVTVAVQVNNAFSMNDIQNIRVTLKQKFTVRTSDKIWSFVVDELKMVSSGIKSGENRIEDDSMIFQIPLLDMYGKHLNTTQAKLVTNSYFIHIEVFMAGSCLGKTSKFEDRLDLIIRNEPGMNINDLN